MPLFQLSLLLLIMALSEVISLATTKLPGNAFDCEIKAAFRDQHHRLLVLDVQQREPNFSKYPHEVISESYRVQIRCVTKEVVQVFVRDTNQFIYRMPQQEPYPSFGNLRGFSPHPQQLTLHIQQQLNLTHCNTHVQFKNVDSYIEVRIHQQEKGNVVLLRGLRLENKFLHFEMIINSGFLMGLGERNGKFKIVEGNYTLWAKDNLFAVQKDLPCQNTYGYHPVLLYKDTITPQFNLAFIRSTSAIEIQIIKREKQQQLTVEIHGNFLEVLLFSQSNPLKLVEEYHEYVGGSKLPPLWYFGFHQSRWGYSGTQKLVEVANGYANAGLKLQSIFLDIDYMDSKKPFRIDEERFVLEDIRMLRQNFGLKIVPIVDFAFNHDFPNDFNDDLAETLGIETNVYDFFLKNWNNDLYIGEVWPGLSIFPDFTHPDIKVFWSQYLQHLSSKIPFDGIWLDMNEIANFAYVREQDLDYSNTFLNCDERLSNMTIPLSVTHSNKWPEFYAHNLNGILQQEATEKVGRRLFGEEFYFVSRNTFPGSGRYGGHWSGDNEAKESYLEYSISSLLNFNLFGIPFVGSDVCGFYGNFQEDLCCKWIRTNSLFPLFRNHNHQAFIDQQFYKIGANIQRTFSTSMNLRYSLLKYIYGLFVLSNGTGMIYSPMLFHFPQDYDTLSHDTFLENQVMIGGNVFFSGSELVYFPRGVTWFAYRTGEKVVARDAADRLLEVEEEMTEELGLFVREGSMVLQQDVEQLSKTDELGNVFGLRCYLDRNGQCEMDSYNEVDLKSIRRLKSTNQTSTFTIQLAVNNKELQQRGTQGEITIRVTNRGGSKAFIRFDKILIFGYESSSPPPTAFRQHYTNITTTHPLSPSLLPTHLKLTKSSLRPFRLCSDKPITFR